MKVNIEDRTIEVFPGRWLSEPQLKENIKGKVDIGNFDVADESQALGELTSTLDSYTSIELNIPKTILEKGKLRAEEAGLSFKEFLRSVLESHI